jgi:hypothetical protein
MPDRPIATTATVGFISDGQRRVIHTVRGVGYLPRED